MPKKIPQVEQYFIEGCGRCPLVGTPDCKVHNWSEPMLQMREIILDCGLTETYKWSQPCYTYDGKNVLILTALKDFAAVSFLKGSLLKDSHGILEKPGKNSQSARYLKFTEVQQVTDLEHTIRDYIREAVELEKAGKKVEFKKQPETMPEELENRLQENPELKKAFYALTPGRQRGYILYFSGAKQSKTRESRIEKYIPKIMEGKGFHDR